MPPSPSGPAGGGPGPPPSAAILTALSLLKRARDAAQELHLDPWEFAVTLAQLIVAGLSCDDVRGLVVAGLVECADERRRTRENQRAFQIDANAGLSARTCFILTPTGERFLKRWDNQLPATGNDAPPALLTPQWDTDRRKLWYREQLVKWYRQPAELQETILTAFEEDGWPPRMDDPLPMVDGIVPRERLHDTLKRLNRDQVTPLLLFRRDGSGEGVTWEGR
jgi:hypothetical protein